MVNIPLLRKVVEWVEEQDQSLGTEWDQEHWITGVNTRAGGFCATAFCVAGKVALMHGWEPRPVGLFASAVEKDGIVSPVSDVAASLLGLTVGQGVTLFDGDNTAEDIRYYAERFAGERL